MDRIRRLTLDQQLTSHVEDAWNQLSQDFETAYASMNVKYMDRPELSFHPYVKLLGFLCLEVKLLHIDGGHSSENVWMDFLIYERFVLSGGYIVFDDYVDPDYSPAVGRTVDKMRRLGVFKNYYEVGQVLGYESSFVLHKPRQAGGLVARLVRAALGG
jgi:hypothetical protein